MNEENPIEEALLGNMDTNDTAVMKNLQMTKKEAAKVTHDINNIWHVRFQRKGEELCVIETRTHEPDSAIYSYYFINHGFDKYEFVAKYPTN